MTCYFSRYALQRFDEVLLTIILNVGAVAYTRYKRSLRNDVEKNGNKFKSRIYKRSMNNFVEIIAEYIGFVIALWGHKNGFTKLCR